MATVIGAANPKDGSIWTTFTDSGDTDYFYCSTSGSDSNDGLSPEEPKQTIAAVINLRIGRDGKPDRILFKRGDVWTDECISSAILNNGRSADEPLVVGAYGDESLARPKFRISRGNPSVRQDGFLTENGNVLNECQYLAIVDLHIVAYKSDPDDPAFGTEPATLLMRSISANTHLDWRLIEGCRFDHCATLHQSNGNDNPEGTFYFRNNVINAVWGASGYATGIFVNSCLRPVFHNNTFINNSWWEKTGEYGSVSIKPLGNGMSHAVYIGRDSGNGEYYNNIAFHSPDMQINGGGIQRDNFQCVHSSAMLLCEPSTIGGTMTLRSGLDVDGCVSLYATDSYDAADPSVNHNSHGIFAYGSDGGSITNCVSAHSEPVVTSRGTAMLMAALASRQDLPCTNVTATGNKVYNVANIGFGEDAVSVAAGSSFDNDATNLEDLDGENTYGWIDPDNGTIEGYVTDILSATYTRYELFEGQVVLQRKGAWNDAYAGYTIVPWLKHQYADASGWVNCYNGE
jgi:hypothetical protein